MSFELACSAVVLGFAWPMGALLADELWERILRMFGIYRLLDLAKAAMAARQGDRVDDRDDDEEQGGGGGE